MKDKIGRYRVPSDEDCEEGSNGEVLKNHLGIILKSEIEAREEQELERLMLEVETLFDKHHQFTSQDLCGIHEEWLADIYPMAGKYRSVAMSKDNFPFATPMRIEP